MFGRAPTGFATVDNAIAFNNQTNDINDRFSERKTAHQEPTGFREVRYRPAALPVRTPTEKRRWGHYTLAQLDDIATQTRQLDELQGYHSSPTSLRNAIRNAGGSVNSRTLRERWANSRNYGVDYIANPQK